jgi:hypothetical protein
VSYDIETGSPDDEGWPKKPDGTPMSPSLAAAFLRGQGQNASSGGGGQRRAKSDGPGDSYVEVKERIQAFYATYPTGAIVTTKVKMVEANFARGIEAIMVQAKAYRTPDDPHPGVGTSWLVVPGHTPYTNGSEVENAETSAWGRAIAAVGILVDRGIASAQEIRMKEGGEIEQPSRTNADALREAAAAAAGAAQAESVSMAGVGAPAPTDTAPVAPVAASSPVVDEEAVAQIVAETQAALRQENLPDPPLDDGATETAAEPEPAPEAAPEAETPEEGKEEVPEGQTPDGLTYDEFVNLAREKFIPNGHIQAIARELMEAGAIQQVGGIRALTDQERLILLLKCMSKMDAPEEGK